MKSVTKKKDFLVGKAKVFKIEALLHLDNCRSSSKIRDKWEKVNVFLYCITVVLLMIALSCVFYCCVYILQ